VRFAQCTEVDIEGLKVIWRTRCEHVHWIRLAQDKTHWRCALSWTCAESVDIPQCVSAVTNTAGSWPWHC